MSVKSVYSLGPLALRVACRKAAKDQILSSKYWDALWYRASVISGQLSVTDISIIIDSMRVFPKFKSPLLAEYLLKNLSSSGNVLDYSMLIRNVSLLDLDPSLGQKLEPNLAKKVEKKSSFSWSDLERVVTCNKSDNLLRLKFSRLISEKLASKTPTSRDPPRVFVNLLYWCLVNEDTQVEDDEEPFFEKQNLQKNSQIITSLLNVCVPLANKFSPADVLAFSRSVKLLNDVAKRNELIPIVSRLIGLQAIHFKPAQITALICLADPKEFPINIALIVKEFEYKIRDFRPINCVRIWHHLRNKFFSINEECIVARLLKYDTNTTLRDAEDLEMLVNLLTASNANRSKELLKNLVPVIRNRTNLCVDNLLK